MGVNVLKAPSGITARETEAALIRYVAELPGADADQREGNSLSLALMVLCCDQLVIALTAAASARRLFA
jgi:hypothetical protein